MSVREPNSDLHEIRNKKRPQAVKGKKGGVRLTGKHMSRARKAAIVLASVLVVGGAAFGVNALFQKEDALVIDPGYGSVSYEVVEGERYTSESDYKPEEIFGRLNWKFR